MHAEPPAASPARDARELRALLAFVCFVTLFEGYDLLIINLALPHLGRDFGADGQTLASAVGLINVGTILAFLPLRLADRYGRRRVFLFAVLGYTVFTMLSACAVGLYDFVAWQCLARMFMVTEIGVGAIILTEEMPARWRGAAVTLMFALSLSGGILGAVVFPLMVDTALGWRLLYLLGGAALPVLLWYWPRLRETQRFAARTGGDFMPVWTALRTVLAAPYRRRAVAGATIWFTVNAWSSSCLFFFAYYVTQERGWDTAAASHALTLGYTFAILGYATAGPMLDLAGRRLTALAYFSLGAASAWVCFTATDPRHITMAYATVLAMQALWPIAATITSEIFPTAIRGTANGIVNNLLGRTGMVFAPALVGGLSSLLGSVGEAVALVSLLPLAVLPIIYLLVAETRGQELERIAS
ncbi:MAG: MFS transporter [Gammaproteobacteria bacterium]